MKSDQRRRHFYNLRKIDFVLLATVFLPEQDFCTTPPLKLCIQFLEKENNAGNNTLPLGLRLCFKASSNACKIAMQHLAA